MSVCVPNTLEVPEIDTSLEVNSNYHFYYFSLLPWELRESVLQEVDFLTISHVVCVSRQYQAECDAMWKLVFKRMYPNASTRCNLTWRELSLVKQPIRDKNLASYGRIEEGKSIYEGQWKDGKKHGFGFYFYGEGDRYEGMWKDGNHHGFGKYFWSNGDVYEGEWVNDEQTGRGKLTWASGNVYDGQWLNSKKEGYGVHYWKNGDIHKGEYKDNRKHGKGEYIWVNKNSVFGVWDGGERVSGTFHEHISSTTFTTDMVDKLDEVHIQFCNPIIVDSVNAGMCTFAKTGSNFYFQYLWRLKWPKDEPHTTGICLSCYSHCLVPNEIKVAPDQANASWGGNFYCLCGAGRLDRPCRLLHPEVYDVKKLTDSFDKMSLKVSRKRKDWPY